MSDFWALVASVISPIPGSLKLGILFLWPGLIRLVIFLWCIQLHITQKDRMLMPIETNASSLFGNLVESFWMDS